MNCILVDRASIFDLNLLFVTLLDVRRAKKLQIDSPTSKFKGRCVLGTEDFQKGFEGSCGRHGWRQKPDCSPSAFDFDAMNMTLSVGVMRNARGQASRYRRKHGDIQFGTTWSWLVAGDGVQCPPGASSFVVVVVDDGAVSRRLARGDIHRRGNFRELTGYSWFPINAREMRRRRGGAREVRVDGGSVAVFLTHSSQKVGIFIETVSSRHTQSCSLFVLSTDGNGNALTCRCARCGLLRET